MITADTITDEQIDALWREACGPGPMRLADADTMHMCTVAVNHHGDFTIREQEDARAGCAAILNARPLKCTHPWDVGPCSVCGGRG